MVDDEEKNAGHYGGEGDTQCEKSPKPPEAEGIMVREEYNGGRYRHTKHHVPKFHTSPNTQAGASSVR